jgi:hypothetical protein
MLEGKALLYTTTALTALGFMLIGYDNVSRASDRSRRRR